VAAGDLKRIGPILGTNLLVPTTGAGIQALGVERWHRTLVITRKGGEVVTIPLAPPTARAIDLAIGERHPRYRDMASWSPCERLPW
jgi:hypothetical protein